MSILNQLPITGVSQTFDTVVLTLSWLIVRNRIHQAKGPLVPTVDHMYRYFGYFAIFNLFMSLPYLVLPVQAGLFPSFMAWGYVIANVFLLMSLSHISRMTLQMLPRLERFDRLAMWLWGGLTLVMTVLNAMVIGMQYQPTFDSVTRVTHYAIPSWMGAMLGMISFLAYLPAIGAFVYGAYHQKAAARVRSLLLIFGLLIIMVVGPLHAVAANWQTFLLADVLNMVSLALLTTGVIYRFKQQGEAVDRGSKSVVAPSNTV